MSVTITATDFKTRFARGQFSYGTTPPAVMDADIDNSILQTIGQFNEGLYPTPEVAKECLLQLTAHFLQLDVDSWDSQGRPVFSSLGHSVDGVSENFDIPEWCKDGAFSFYVTTSYGLRFLILSKPYLDGAVVSVGGGTQF